MSENTSSTNVDSGKKDKYSEDIKKGVPEYNCCIPGITFDNERASVNIVGEMQTRDSKGNPIKVDRVVVSTDAIRDFGEVGIAVENTNNLEKVKATLKARQAAQEKAMAEKEQDNEQEK